MTLILTSNSQPDINYHPDWEKYCQRTTLRLKAEPSLPNTPLPEGFPSQVDHPSVWEGKDWTHEEQWVYRLSAVELKEIDDALTHFKCKYNHSLPYHSIF